MSKTKILFVCLGNICRSACAEAVMKQVVAQRGMESDFEIDSAGLISYHSGEKADPRMRQHAANRGINITSIARKITTADFSHFDYIIGMDSANMRNMQRIYGGDPENKVYKMLDFAGRSADVADPWYTGNFDATWNDVVDGCNGLISKVIGATT